MNSTERPKVLPMKIKDMLSSSDEFSSPEKPITTVRKKVEPMKMKDLIKSLSSRKKPDPPKSLERRFTMTRKSTAAPASVDSHARRKLYTSQNTPHHQSRQSKIMPATKNRPQNTPRDLNRPAKVSSIYKVQPSAVSDTNNHQTSRKSLLLPPNKIKDFYMQKGLSRVSEASCEDATIQTDDESDKEESSSLTKSTKSKCACQCAANRSFESLPSSQTCNEMESAINEKSATFKAEKQGSTELTAPICTDNITEKRVEIEGANVPVQVPRSAIVTDSSCGFLIQPLLANQILLQVPQNVDNPKTPRHIPFGNRSNITRNEQILVDKENLLAIEDYLKEGIVNMTQALSLIQATLYSSSTSSQVQPTVLNERENIPVLPIPITPVAKLIDLSDLKIEQTCGGDKGANENLLTNQEIISSLQVEFDNCLNLQETNVPSEANTRTREPQEITERIENAVSLSTQESPKSAKSESSELKSLQNENLPRTPKKNLKNIENNLLKTPKNSLVKLMTPCKRMDNKENFLTPLVRRRSFSGLDSQNLRRSVRIARHHLRQSLGEDSFLALERELNIVYPRPNA